MTVNIRQAAQEDYSALCELFDEIDAYHRDRLPHLFKHPGGPARDLEYFSWLVSDENVGFFVAEIDERLVGLIHALVRDAPDIPILVPRRYAIVDTLVVKSDFQQQGIGKQLMDSIQAWALAKGATCIELSVYEFNQTAISFYEGLGYQTLSRKMSKDLIVTG
jgi:ribosomal protein S18 acetylase RimI-like enzyme